MLEDQVEHAVVLFEIVQLDNVGVVQLLQDLDLVDQSYDVVLPKILS